MRKTGLKVRHGSDPLTWAQGRGLSCRKGKKFHSKAPVLYFWNKSISHWHKGVKHAALKIQGKNLCIWKKGVKKEISTHEEGQKNTQDSDCWRLSTEGEVESLRRSSSQSLESGIHCLTRTRNELQHQRISMLATPFTRLSRVM